MNRFNLGLFYTSTFSELQALLIHEPLRRIEPSEPDLKRIVCRVILAVKVETA